MPSWNWTQNTLFSHSVSFLISPFTSLRARCPGPEAWVWDLWWRQMASSSRLLDCFFSFPCPDFLSFWSILHPRIELFLTTSQTRIIFIIFQLKDIPIDVLERGEGRQQNTNVREKHQSVFPYAPYWGSNPQPRYVLRGIKPATFWCMGQCSSWATWPPD